jgi:phage tail sheath protein FI
VSPAPGHSVEISDRPPARIAAADTAAAFMVGLTERGKGDAPVLCRSITHFESQLGARYSTPTLYDAADAYFREGGSILYVVPVLGPAKATATDTIAAASGVALNVFATSPGAWGNDIDVANDTTGGNFVLTVSYLGAVVETSPVLATTADAVAWAAESSDYITLTVGTGADPVDDTANLAGGTRDDGGIGDAQWAAALALFTSDYGPGQVLAPGRTTSQGYLDLLAHADAFKRVALLDGANTHTVATLTSAASALNGETGDRFGGLFAPWAIVPGLAPGTTRTVPYSAIQAGLIARSDAKGANPNVAAAGSNGIPRYAVDLSQAPWTEAERDTLNQAGVNVAVAGRNGLRTMGDRSLADPLTDTNWIALSNSRLMMAAAARVGDVLSDFEFAQIDGRGFKLAELAGRLKGALNPFYIAGALYGRTPDEAFAVNVGGDVNTPTTIANGEIHAAISLRVSPRAEIVDTVIVKVPVTESV